MQVIEFNDQVLTLAQFTSNIQEAVLAIEAAEVGGATELYNALYISNGISWIRVSNNLTATGGTKTTHGIYTVHSFTSGTTTWTPDRSGNVDILLVAGGGGAGGA